MDNALEYVDNSLEELELGETNWSLVLSILIFICWDASWVLWRLEEGRNNVFSDSLMSTTI